eukprot:GHRR01018167.1.p2 GENE.GHRR01018167.1~~GHRR01018167.1.p2  ORF type:complete len:271 (+),score=98.79 GHRR01018167.1:464-1276(+)
MGNASSKGEEHGDAVTGRAVGITGGGALKRLAAPRLPPGAVKARPEDYAVIEEILNKVLLFNKLERHLQRKVVSEMYEQAVTAGEILIKEGDTGLAASELYVVKSGKFEVLQRRHGVNVRVNLKERGDCFGELALMYICPRTATVAATTDAVVWVLERDVFRYFVRNAAETQVSEVELFLNSVPILSSLNQEEKLQLVDAFEEKTYNPGDKVSQTVAGAHYNCRHTSKLTHSTASLQHSQHLQPSCSKQLPVGFQSEQLQLSNYLLHNSK